VNRDEATIAQGLFLIAADSAHPGVDAA